MDQIKTDYAQLLADLEAISHFQATLNLLDWDTQVAMPAKGAERRAKTVAFLTGLHHQKYLSLNENDRLARLHQAVLENKLTEEQAITVTEVWRTYQRLTKLPEDFVTQLSQITSEAHTVWAKARETNNFSLFQPYLEKIIELKRQEADYLGYEETPYNALLDEFEPDMTVSQLDPILESLKKFLIPFIKKAVNRPENSPTFQLSGSFPAEQQIKLSEQLARLVGYDLEAGRIDSSHHPFSNSLHPLDSRITTTYKVDDPLYALSAILHETGHALYEQGLPHEHTGTPLAEAISHAIHESQSRLWENQVGTSYDFWIHAYPLLQEALPQTFGSVSLSDFYQYLTQVRPSLIRTAADEVTYNLHIVIRYELERALIEKRLAVADLPAAWNEKYKTYLGIEVPNDAQGVLQDVHWSAGYFGYFPTYTLGNLYAAQIFSQAEKELPNLREQFRQGNFQPLRHWLLEAVHKHGKRFTAEGLVKNITGQTLSNKAFEAYLEQKYF